MAALISEGLDGGGAGRPDCGWRAESFGGDA